MSLFGLSNPDGIMKFLIGFAAAHPRSVLMVLLTVTVLAAFLVPQLEVRISAEAMMAEGGPGRGVYDETLRTFGSSNAVVVVFRDTKLFTPQTLAAVRSVVDELGGLAFIEGIDSLFTLKQGRLIEGEVVQFSPYLDPIPATPAAAESIKADALANVFVARNLLSEDGRTMAINVRLKPRATEGSQDRVVVEKIEQVISPLRSKVDEVFALGRPHLGTYTADLIVRDQMTIMPLSFAVMLLALFVALGRWEGMLLPMMTALASVILTLAFMVVSGIAVNVLTSVAPLLLLVVGSTEDIHLLAAYFARTREGVKPLSAVDAMAASTGFAVLLTFVTTYFGFLAIALNDIALLRDFAIVASTGLLFNFVITILMVPSVLALLKAGSNPRQRTEDDRYQRIAGWLHGIASRRRAPVALVSLILIVAASIGAAELRVNNNFMDYFPGDSPIIQQSQQLHRELAGVQTLDVVLSSGIEGTFERVRYLQEVKKLQRFFDASGRFDKTLSFVDIIEETNRVMEGLPPGELYLPADDAVVRELLFFTDGTYLRPYVSDDLGETRITVRHAITSSRELQQILREIDGFVEANIDPGLEVVVTGESALTQSAGDALAAGQAKSLVLVLLAVFLIISAVFMNLKAGALAVVPNVLPVVVLFGVMGYADIPLNAGTAMVAAIAIGICVDDTMHFLVRYHQQMAVQPTADDAIGTTMKNEARPIMATTLALTLGFGVLAFSSFPPVVHFGLLGALVFVLALAATFVVTPILLSHVRLVTVWDVLSVHVRSNLMEKCDLFRGMGRFQVRKLIAMSSRKMFDVGEYIVRQGDESHELFVILEGRVQAQRQDAAGELVLLNEMRIGDIFGEIALTADTKRTADIFVLEKTEVLALRWTDLQGLGRYMPRTSSRLLLNIAASMGQRMISRNF